MKKQKTSLASKILLSLTDPVLLPSHHLWFIFSFNDSRSLTRFSGFCAPVV